ncbi:MAG: hypothetical protein R3B09_15615 [Nannocystaceae bacterium]
MRRSPGPSRARALAAILLAAILLAAATGCQDPDTEVTQGIFVRYAWEPTLTPCGGAARTMDAFVPFVRGQLGLDPEGQDGISYTWLTQEAYERVEPDRLAPTSGICHGDTAYGIFPVMVHEMVHAVDPSGGGGRFFIEGMAVAFAPDLAGGDRYRRRDPRPYLTADFTADPETKDNLYQRGGAFVAYLVGRHGPARFLELRDRLSMTASEDRIRRVFADVYGADLDDEVEFFLSDACPDEASELPIPHACEGEAVPWVSAREWRDVRAIDCDDASAVGGIGETFSQASVAVTLEVPEAGAYELRRFGEPDGAATLVSCGRCAWLAWDRALSAVGQIAALEPGRYALIHRVDAASLGLSGVRILRVPEHDADLGLGGGTDATGGADTDGG